MSLDLPDWHSVYDTYGVLLFRYLLARGASNSVAEDVVQQVFTQAIQAASVIENPGAYLFASARREFARLRPRQSEHNVAPPTLDLLADESEPVEDGEDRERVREVLRSLEVELREVVVLRVWHELTFRELGEVLGIPLNTAASRWRRATQEIESRLRRQEAR